MCDGTTAQRGGPSRSSKKVFRAKCHTCGWETRPLEGSTWKLPQEQAEQATGAHVREAPDHDVGVVRVA